MVMMKKKNVHHTYITLKECVNNPDWKKMYEVIKRDTEFRLKNHFYDD